ncbi:MAG: chromate efflux transporter [Bdellovibrionota bacterium]|nr:chromate efflux transporter [Bdellovibrionota bacterium]
MKKESKQITAKELFKVWGYVAAHSFGGPAGQIAVIHKLVVEERKIISEERFLHALNFCMLLPGPEAQQLATYMGFLMSKWKGGIIAGGLFILPGFLSILTLSYLYVLYNDLSLVQGLFYGIKPAIIAVVLSALYRISKKSLKNSFYWILATLAFVALFFFNLSFPLVVIGSAVLGVLYGKFVIHPELQEINDLQKPALKETISTLLIWLSVWFFPILLTCLLLGSDSTMHILNIFFSKMSLVTFGGAYAALSYVAQQAVEVYGWLEGTEMLDGLALAEATPGPLIQVVQYVGFMGAYRFPQEMNPLFSALLGSFLTTWMTFAPCFLFIFSFAPYIEFIRGQIVFTDALSAITASIVGVIFNLSLWFVLKALFLQSKDLKYGILDFNYPILSSLDWYAAGICLIAIFMQFNLKAGLFSILGVSTTLGIIIKVLG